MVEQRTVTWEEGAGDLQRFSMPELGFFGFQAEVEGRHLAQLVFKLDDEANLGGDAEVGNDHEAHLEGKVGHLHSRERRP